MATSRANIRVHKGTSFLRWAAGIVSLAPGVFACTRVLVEEIVYDANLEFFLQGFVLFLLFLVVPGLIAWRWHLIGGLFLVFHSGFHILLIVWGNYLELDRTYALRIILPFWVAFCTGGVLHLAVWWRERKEYRV